MAQHIAIDLGATSGRIVVGNGKELDVIYRFTSFNEKILGSYYWEIFKIFSEIKIGLRKAFDKYGDEIVSIGIDGWGVDYGLLDKNGNLINPVYHYRDKRTSYVFDEVNSLIGENRLFSTTGIAFQEYNTIYQLFSQVKENCELFTIVKNYLSVPDLFAYFLSGKIVNERTHASTTALYNCNTKDWAWDIIEDLKLPKSMFSKIVDSGTIIGSLTKDLSDEFKISHDVKIVASATHDTAAAVSNIRNSAYISSGTWSLMGVNLESPILNSGALSNGFTNETGSQNQITFVKNIMGMWISNQCIEDYYGKDSKKDWKQIDKITEENLSYDGYIDPTDLIFLEPSSASNKMVDRVNMNLKDKGFKNTENIGEVLVSVYRGLAKTYASSLKQIEKITNKKIDSLQIIGGGCKNKLLNSLTEAEIGKKVKTGPVEATAMGNIQIQIDALKYNENL